MFKGVVAGAIAALVFCPALAKSAPLLDAQVAPQTTISLSQALRDPDGVRARQEEIAMGETLGIRLEDLCEDQGLAGEYVRFLYQERFVKPLSSIRRTLEDIDDVREYVDEKGNEALAAYQEPTDSSSAIYWKGELESVLERALAAKQEEEERAAQEAARKAQEEPAAIVSRSSGLTAASGVNYYGGRRETYYSSRVLYHYLTPEWTCDAEGFWRDSAGRYVVASNDYAQGTVIDTSKGTSIVLDSGCPSGTVDFYVSW